MATLLPPPRLTGVTEDDIVNIQTYLNILARAIGVLDDGSSDVPNPLTVGRGGTGNQLGIVGDGLSYIDSGIVPTLPTSPIDHLRVVASPANCTAPTIAFYAGTQSPPTATGGGTATLTTSGGSPTKTITGGIITNGGSYSWPPNGVVTDATGTGQQIDAVLNTALMTTMSTSAGFLVSGGVRYAVPAYTHTYPEGSVSSITYFDYFNTETLQWVTRDSALGSLGSPNVLIRFVQVGGAPSWTNGGDDAAPLQIYAVGEIAGRLSLSSTVYTTYQQGSGQATQQGRNYAPLLGINDGIGGANFKGRFFSVQSGDPSTRPYSNLLDINPQLVLSRNVPERAGLTGDFGPVISFGMQDSTAVDVNAVQLFATMVDVTAGQMQGELVVAVANKDSSGDSVGAWSFGPGVTSTNSADGAAARKGYDTINVNGGTNSDSNPGGYYVDGDLSTETSLTKDKLSFGLGDITVTRSVANTLSFAGASNSYSFDTTILGESVVWAGHGTAITAGGSASGLWLSSTSIFGVFCGSGAPTMSAAKGALYLRSDGSGVNDRMYVNTNGTTGWTAVVTVA